jgi:molecular chaperone DnaJ
VVSKKEQSAQTALLNTLDILQYQILAIYEGGSVMPKNYYIILGIPADSSHSDIKSAYRRLAKEFHPDYYGESPSPFQAIQEAYSVLSDPSQRKKYDDSLNTLRIHSRGEQYADAQRAFYQTGVEPLVPEQGRVEPLTPQAAGMPLAMGPGIDSLFNRFFNIASLNWDYGKCCTDYEEMEVLLTAEQAQRGGHIRVYLPAQVHCPSCQGWASSGLQECWRCFGEGYLRGEVPILLNYPPGISNNHIVEFALSRFGFPGNSLKVRFKIADFPH